MIFLITTVVFFLWFLTAMWFLRRRHILREKLGPVYFIIVGIVLGGLPLDVVWNWTFGIVMFVDVTRDLTFSKRLQRYRESPLYHATWRMRWADFICERILNPFDPKKHHC